MIYYLCEKLFYTKMDDNQNGAFVLKERRKGISFNFEIRQSGSNYPIFLRITENGRHLRYKTTITLSRKSDWDSEKQKIKYTEPNRDKWQKVLDELKEKALTIHRELEEESVSSPDKIIETLRGGTKSDSFLDFAEQYRDVLRERGQLSTFRKYDQVCRKFTAFMQSRRREPHSVKFKEIDYSFVKAFDAFLHTLDNQQYATREVVDGKRVKVEKSTPGAPKLHQNYISKILRYFKTLLLMAEKEKLLKHDDNPFTTYKIEAEDKIQKEELTLEEVMRIIDLKLEEGSPAWNSRNFFLFAMYCAGIRVGDLLCLRWRNVTTDGRLHYQMEKNHKIQDVPLLPPALVIIDLYRGEENENPDDFIFPYMKKGKYAEEWLKLKSTKDIDSMDGALKLKYKQTVSAKEAIVNKGLKTVREMAGITKPLSTHIARHTFARLAKEVHTDNSLLQGLLMHSSISTTERYMGRFSSDARDEALKEIFKPLAPEMMRKKELLEQLGELSVEELEAVIVEYKRKQKTS